MLHPVVHQSPEAREQRHFEVSWLTLSLQRVINVKFPLQPHRKHCITQYEELGFSYPTQMKHDYTSKSHYLTNTFLFIRLGECTF